MAFNPNQPRVPKGSGDASGEWVSPGAGVSQKKAKEVNIEVAKKIAADMGHQAKVYSNPKSGFAAAFSQGEVHINAAHKAWADPAGFMGRASELSSKDPAHIIRHEVGHAKFDAPDNFMRLADQDMARSKVSKYAARNPKEFVAEVFAGQKAGKTYDDEVMGAFNRYAKKR